ncbi:Octicosapeptide/Phox/Bem1p family protein [Abeliophyllum distichum]|uniref:Octicosapeptide/Phox/Bem1p family protein n=1 Tax=Abeliophyllum distichum TaxID=126358 RepID=A0ABD1TGZ6_9LAMI
MENYSYNSYPESGDSSPRSREIEFENPPPWEDGQTPYKVKFMCSYGGKIHPRPHDNLLSYIGGETKILAVDRNVKFGSLLSKLIALCDNDNISFKYQLPGEDLDALISVTNDDDLEHMMHEYDRLYRVSPKPARLRLFIFSNPHTSLNSSARSFGSDEVKSEKERFVEALNTGPVLTAPPPPAAAAAVAPQPPPPSNNVDFLFGLEKGNGMAPPPPPIVGKVQETEDPAVPNLDERLIGSDPIQKHIQDLQRLRLEEQQGIYRRKSDDNLAGGFVGGEYYKMQEKVSPVPMPGGVPMPTGYWPEKQVGGGVYPASTLNTEQPVYIIPGPAGGYHAPPMMRPVTGPNGQGYYAVQRMPPEAYREQPVYNVMPSVQPQSAVPSMAAAPQKVTGYSEGYGMVRPTTTTGGGGVGVATEAGYAQVAYDGGMGRQVMYTAAPGGVPAQVQQAQYQAMAAAAELRSAGSVESGNSRG